MADPALGWLVEQWTAQLGRTLEAMLEQRAVLASEAPSPLETLPALDNPFWYELPFDLPAGAALWVGAAEQTWLAIGGFALLAVGLTDSEPSDNLNTYTEILAQATSALAHSISSRTGKATASQPGRKAEAPPAETLASVLTFRFPSPDTPAGQIYLAVSPELTAALDALETAKAAAKCSDAPRADTALTAVSEGAPLPVKSKTLDLLMEIELPVSVSFGRAQLPLRDVLKLNSGSVVELNRTISDPVEIIINDFVIARGDVVVVEGNYGVRINQIVSRQDRMRTLR